MRRLRSSGHAAEVAPHWLSLWRPARNERPWERAAALAIPLFFVITVLASCQREKPGGPAPAEQPPVPSSLRPGGQAHSATPTEQRRLDKIEGRSDLLFTFFNHRADMLTVERISDIPLQVRGDVMVTDPNRLLPGDEVFVADLREMTSEGDYRWWIESRSGWLARVMPSPTKLPGARAAGAGQSSGGQAPGTSEGGTAKAGASEAERPRPRPRARPKTSKRRAAATGKKAPEAVMFSTSWCPSCRKAKQYFRSRGIALLELDVERDQQAAQQYQQLVRSYRLKAGAVPLIIVNGRIIQEFNKSQIEAALAAPPPSDH